MDKTCPKCDTEFETEEWLDGHCPNCNYAYYWEEECTEDYSDCWTCFYWQDDIDLLNQIFNTKTNNEIP